MVISDSLSWSVPGAPAVIQNVGIDAVTAHHQVM
jgi:hypothetical protein